MKKTIEPQGLAKASELLCQLRSVQRERDLQLQQRQYEFCSQLQKKDF